MNNPKLNATFWVRREIEREKKIILNPKRVQQKGNETKFALLLETKYFQKKAYVFDFSVLNISKAWRKETACFNLPYYYYYYYFGILF